MFFSKLQALYLDRDIICRTNLTCRTLTVCNMVTPRFHAPRSEFLADFPKTVGETPQMRLNSREKSLTDG